MYVCVYIYIYIYIYIYKGKGRVCRYRPGVAQRVGRGIALLFHERGTRRRWVFSSTPRPHFTPGKDPVPILRVQEAAWAPGPFWTGGKSRPHRYSIPHRPAHSHSLYRLSYGLDGPGSNPGGDEIFRASRTALGPTQPPVQCVLGLSRGLSSRGVALTTHLIWRRG